MTEEEKKQSATKPKIDPERYERECRILAGMLFHPKKYYGMVRQIGLQPLDFVDSDTALAFNALLAVGDEEKDAIKRMDLVEAESKKLKDLCTHLAGYQEEPATIEDMAFLRQKNSLDHYKERLQKIFEDKQLKFPMIAELLKSATDHLYSDHRHIANALDGDVHGKADIYSTPEHLTYVPGIVNMLIKVTLASSFHPNRVMALSGALAIMAHLMARRYRAFDDTRPNLYLIMLSGSGGGKNDPRVASASLLKKLGMLNCLSVKPTSAQGLEDKIIDNPCTLLLRDEIDTLFNQLNTKNPPAEEMMQTLLTIFSSSRTVLPRRDKAKSGKGPETKYSLVECPSLTILGTGIPQYFYRALTERTVANGALSRCIVLESGRRGEDNLEPKPVEFEDSLMNLIKAVLDKKPMSEPDQEPYLHTIELAEGAKEKLVELRQFSKQQYQEHENAEYEPGKAIWSRFIEMVMKLSMIYAVSENPGEPHISAAGLKWAADLMECSIQRVLVSIKRYVGGNEMSELINKVLDKVRRAGSAGITRSEVLQSVANVNAQNLDIIERTLADRGDIEVMTQGKRKIYRLILKEKK